MSRRRGIAVLAAGALLAVACGGPGGGVAATGAGRAVFRLDLPEPTGGIDPALSPNAGTQIVTRPLYEGLLALDDATLTLRPALATAWAADPGCRRWTFHLRRGSTFSTGEEVTARSFVDGMTRAVAEPTSGVAYHLAGVVGFDALAVEAARRAQAGVTTPWVPVLAGLSAPDPATLVVALSKADCEFDDKAIQPVMSPVPAGTPPAGDRRFGDQPIGNGPFRLKEPWRHDRRITLVRNERYHGPRPALDEVRMTIIPPTNVNEDEYRAFQAGLVDWAHIPLALVPHARALFKERGRFLDRTTVGLTYLVVNTTRPPFDRPAARKALSAAFDRQAISRGLLKGFSRPATSLVPPALSRVAQEGVCDACRYDPDRARRWAAEAGLAAGIRFAFSYQVNYTDNYAQAIAHQVEATLGWRVDLDPVPASEVTRKLSQPTFAGLALYAWTADYPTAENFLGPLLSAASADNRSRYANPAVDALLERARAAVEPDRTAMLQEAERIAIGADLALIPLWYRSEQRVVAADRFADADLDFFTHPTLARIRPRSTARSAAR